MLKLVVIRSESIKESVGFYKKIGLKFEYHQHGKGPFHYSSINEEIVFEIYPLLKTQKKADATLRLGFKVDNLDKLITNLESVGIRISNPPQLTEFGYTAVAMDYDGRKIELTEIEIPTN